MVPMRTDANGQTGLGSWETGKCGNVGFQNITDGTSNTIMVIETADLVPWAKPGDFPFDPKKDLPKIAPVRGLAEWLAALPSSGDEQRLVLSLRDARPLHQGNARAVLSLSGPEGGLAEAEEDAARRAGFTPLSLGPRTLRADTAPLALLARLGAAGE